MLVGVRAAYPETGEYNWYDALKPWGRTRTGVEVAFHKPEPFMGRVKVEAVVEPFGTLNIPVLSVHMAHAPINRPGMFVAVLEKTLDIARQLGCSLIVAHPSNGRLEEVEGFLEAAVRPMLDEANAILCWETFLGRRRFLHGFEDLVDFVFHRPEFAVCYDTAHLRRGTQEIRKDIAENTLLIGVFHISNWEFRKQHLRIGDGEIDFKKVMRTVKQWYEGPVILEYLREYHPYLEYDSGLLRYWLDRGKKPEGSGLTEF